LTRRQQLIVRYPIIDINFMKACVNEIREHKCDQAFKAENTTIEKLSVVLICLGSVAREGKWGILGKNCFAFYCDTNSPVRHAYLFA
jgi:hypothetical protein